MRLLDKRILMGTILGAHIIYGLLIIYLVWPISTITIAKLGNVGAAYGVLASLASGLGFGALVITILMQRQEISVFKEQLELQEKSLQHLIKETTKAEKVNMKLLRNNTISAIIAVEQYKSTTNRKKIPSNIIKQYNKLLNEVSTVEDT